MLTAVYCNVIVFNRWTGLMYANVFKWVTKFTGDWIQSKHIYNNQYKLNQKQKKFKPKGWLKGIVKKL